MSGQIEEFINLAADRFGLDEDAAGRAVAMVLTLVREHVGGEEARGFIARLPGAEHLLASVDTARGGLVSGLLSNLNQRLGGDLANMKAVGELARAGLQPNDIGSFLTAFAGFAAAQAGTEETERIMSRIPGLENFF